MPSSKHQRPPARRILVLEDDALNAFFIEDTLRHIGVDVIGPVATVEQALDRSEEEAVDAAILDLQIGDEQSFEVGRKMESLGIPWAFATGHTHGKLPEELSHVPLLAKPFTVSNLLRLVENLLGKVD